MIADDGKIDFLAIRSAQTLGCSQVKVVRKKSLPAGVIAVYMLGKINNENRAVVALVEAVQPEVAVFYCDFIFS